MFFVCLFVCLFICFFVVFFWGGVICFVFLCFFTHTQTFLDSRCDEYLCICYVIYFRRGDISVIWLLANFRCVECLFICSVVVSQCGWYLSLLIMCVFSLWSLHQIIYVIMISFYSTSVICQFMSHGLIIKHLWRGSNWK